MTTKQQLPDIKNLAREALVSWLKDRGIEPYRASQILKWVYQRQTDDFEAMTDIKKEIRSLLSGQFAIRRLETVKVEESQDGSKKFLFRLEDENHVESVLIPEKGHYTLCISSQVGCALGCRFCLTARGGLVRSLEAGEIVAQVRDVMQNLSGAKRLTNIVLMGMGEPLANYENVLAAVKTLTDSDTGLEFSSRRVTISTAGLANRLADLGRDCMANLAVSLNATDNKTRSMLMPINKKFPLETLLAECARFPLPARRRITFEYILLKGVNDTEADVRRLIKLLRPIRAKINLIPFNTFEGCDFERPNDDTVLAFRDILKKHHFTVIVRYSKGQDISAACGQLNANTLRASR